MVPKQVALQPPRGNWVRHAAALVAALIPLSAPADARERPRLAYPGFIDDDAVSRQGRPQLRYPSFTPVGQLAPADLSDALLDDNDGLNDAQKLALLAQNYRPRPAIWRIGDRDTIIYLFGTIHILPPGFEWRSPALDRIVARSSTLILESVDRRSGIDGLQEQTGRAGRLPPLSMRVGADHRAKLAAFTASLPPQAVTLFDQMPSWIASVAISLVREIRSGELPGPGADDWLEARFVAAKKPVSAIEDSQQVIARVNAVPESEQQQMLHAALDAPIRSRAEMRAATHAWAKGEIGPDSPLTIDLRVATGSDALAGPLLTDRNRAWASELIKRLRRPGTTLFAAGAGHFIGAGSLIDALEARGVRVMRVQ
ncbi:TraB/GumN family protein [Sphingomonas sp. 28-63-12]|uniref:TraB/GumN family protein n=1 Tax=Sphingomonas sp. 28-63-12 TaxID=1970434 RepID=UPI000BCDB700|nr:MAG: hypothetical protein B7Y47_03410 [Sphingomonas sp. 28-63-12]